MLKLGQLKQQVGKIDESFVLLKRSMLIVDRVFGRDSLEAALRHNLLGDLYVESGSLDSALEHYKAALGIEEALFGRTHAGVRIIVQRMAEVHTRKGELREAMSWQVRMHEHVLHVLPKSPAFIF